MRSPTRTAATRRRAIVEATLAAGPTPAALLAAATAAIDALESEPSEPMLLNYAGAAFYEVGALQGAEALFASARRLDRELPHVDRNLRACAQRRRRNARVLPQAAGAMRELTPRALRIAASAACCPRGR